MGSPWTDLDRPPLSADRLQRDVCGGELWRELRVVARTTSTNADVVAAARRGAPEGLVVVAEEQSAGRGRLGRDWQSPPRAGLLVSVLLRPRVPAATLPLVPLLTGLALVEALRGTAGVAAVLKWPNDVLVDGRKVAGVLVERWEDAVVVGLGVNVSTREGELPGPEATSVALAGGTADREPLLKEVLRALARRYLAWSAATGASDSVLPAYREVCDTLGRQVTVHLPDDERFSGDAVGIDDNGHLVVRTAAGEERPVSAGDVVHLRAEA